MALDRVSLEMIRPHLAGADVLALGWPAGFVVEGSGIASIECVDVIAHEGFERIVDLNKPQEWPRQYDLVINPGTLEHCFNIGQAWVNAWTSVKKGGRILHVLPATMLNHGFWNICPIAIQEWCSENGGAVEQMLFATNGSGAEVVPHRITASKSGRGALPEETVLYALCRKNDELPIQWPSQAIYR